MRALDRDRLALVTGGGDSKTRVTTPVGTYESSQSDYAKCVDTMSAKTREQYPDTRPWWNPFATDDNAQQRADATMKNVGANCGPPPQG